MRKVIMIVAISICLTGLVIAGFPRIGDAQQIYGCYGKIGGVLRVTSGPGKCTKWETPISWNAVGPQGPAGPPGPAGKDGLPGPPGVGNLGVYDGSGLFLGYFIRTIPEASYEIFNPEIQAFLQVVFQNPPSLMGLAPNSDGFYYISADCSGKPYFLVHTATFFQELFNVPYRSNTYYIFDPTSPIVKPHDLKSWMPPNMVCYATEIHPPPTNPESPYAAFPIKQFDKADIPILNITLQYPIIIKPME